MTKPSLSPFRDDDGVPLDGGKLNGVFPLWAAARREAGVIHPLGSPIINLYSFLTENERGGSLVLK